MGHGGVGGLNNVGGSGGGMSCSGGNPTSSLTANNLFNNSSVSIVSGNSYNNSGFPNNI